VVRTGGKQYRVSTGEKLRIEKLAVKVGSELVLDEVLLVGEGQALKVGTPVVKGAFRQGQSVGPRPRRKSDDIQDAPAQELEATPRAPSGLHRNRSDRHRSTVAGRRRTERQAMAHKKAGGSSRNGARLPIQAIGRQGASAGNSSPPAASSSGSAEPAFTPGTTSAWERPHPLREGERQDPVQVQGPGAQANRQRGAGLTRQDCSLRKALSMR